MTRNGAKNRKADAIVDYFDQRYGQGGPKLAAWQAFSRDVGVPEGQSITQCKKILKNVHVNIVDFVHANQTRLDVFHFDSRGALARYIKANSSKRFPLKRAKADSFLKTLLIHLY